MTVRFGEGSAYCGRGPQNHWSTSYYYKRTHSQGRNNKI